MKSFSYILSICCCLLTVSCKENTDTDQINNKYSQSIISNNISNMEVSSFVEDRYGYMWIGTKRGLNRYNGHDFHLYFNEVNDSTSINDNKIRSLFMDSQNRLWISTADGVCLYNPNKDNFSRIPVISKGPNALQILEDKKGRIFVNMSRDLCEYDPKKNIFFSVIKYDYKAYINTSHIDEYNRIWIVSQYYVQCYDSSYKLLLSMEAPSKNNYSYYSYMQNNGDIWVFFDNRLSIVDTHTNTFKKTPSSISKHKILSNSIVNCIYAYNKDEILISTQRDGLFLFNTKTEKVTQQSDTNFPFDITNKEVMAIYSDSRQNLWLGSKDEGFFIDYKYKQQFNINNLLRTITDKKSITSILLDKQNNIWLLSPQDGKIILYNIESNDVNIIDPESFLPKELKRNKINYIYMDSANNIWFFIRDKAFSCKYNKEKITINKEYSFPVDICSFAEDSHGTIWIGGYSEYAYGLRANALKFEPLQLYPTDYTFIRSIITLSSGEVLFNSFKQNLKLLDPKTWNIREVKIEKALKRPVYIPSTTFEDSDKNIWIGTDGNGLLCYLPKVDSIISYRDLIPCHDISSITEDKSGNIWIGTLYGLYQIRKKTRVIKSYYSYDGIGGNQYYRNSVCILPDSSLIFGGTHGLTFFNPLAIASKSPTPLYFENLKIRNKLQIVTNSQSIDENLLFNPQINLGYKEGNIAITYVALDYNEYSQIRSYYKMEKYDKDWIEAGYNRQANYSNLPPGSYNFRVKVTTDDDTILNENSISVNVAQTRWLSWPAIFIYVILIISFIIYINYLYLRIRIGKSKAKLALKEKEYESNRNQMNMSFFANVSHEFRTPLTMISGPISILSKDQTLNPQNKYLIEILSRSVNRMLRLVNQLLDFNRLENDTLKLEVTKMDVTHEIKLMLELFEVNAKNKNIKFNTYGLKYSYLMLLDRDKLEKITENILINALKHSSEGGQIDVEFEVIDAAEAQIIFPNANVSLSSMYIKLSIANEGPIIPSNKLNQIFDRYYQIEDNSGINKQGTGIGLYYAKRLVELHHGYIKAGNKGSKGSVFIFILPSDNEVYGALELVHEDSSMERGEEFYQSSLMSSADSNKSYTILVVDDDPDVSQYLNMLLSPIYNVVNKFDGDTAYEIIEELAPDLILSDVLMPILDGYQFCKKLKENTYFCHIPIILLTAKTLVEEQIIGLNTGANAYISKPFDPFYLLAVIQSQLRNRDYIQGVVVNSTKINNVSENLLSFQDKKFLNSLYELMETELSNTELNIIAISEKMGMSRGKLYYKIKGLTGSNPNLFFRTYKLNRAAQFLKEGKYNISEIAILTGFNTLSHFSTSFKKQFGCSPSDY